MNVGLFAGDNYNMAKIHADANMLRHKVLLGNMANVETPGYQRRDIDKSFATTLASKVESGERAKNMLGTKPTVEFDGKATFIKPDGNNVLVDNELMHISENSLEYEFNTTLMSGSLKRLKMAITGRVN